MEQSAAAIIITTIVVFVFLPAFYFRSVRSDSELVNQKIYLAARALEDCVLQSEQSMEDIANGYLDSDDPIMRIKIDEGKLLTEFDNLLYKSVGNQKKYVKIQDNIVCKVLIYPDRFVVTGDNGIVYRIKKDGTYSYTNEFDRYEDNKMELFSAPKFFTYPKQACDANATYATAPKSTYYINTLNTKMKKVGDPSSWTQTTTTVLNLKSNKFDKAQAEKSPAARIDVLSEFDKNQAIINSINEEILKYTGGLKVKFPNPANNYEKNFDYAKREYNFFTGITFLIIYKEDQTFNVSDGTMRVKNYSVAGYTLEN